jgi:hypothetical protein
MANNKALSTIIHHALLLLVQDTEKRLATMALMLGDLTARLKCLNAGAKGIANQHFS